MEFYVKVKSICDNCTFQCGVQLDPHVISLYRVQVAELFVKEEK